MEGIRLTHEQQRKIRFDVSILNEEGLYGPPDGLRSLQYEFCIPAREEIVRVVSAIDTTLQIHRNARGRIPCRPDQYLCVGHTHQANYLTVLSALADLSYVERIEQAFFED